MRFPLASVLAAILLPAAAASAQRLPPPVTPDHYDLSFIVDLTHERFEGTETIKVAVATPTPRVVLNAADITFREVTIGTGAAAQKAVVTLDEEAQTATLTVPTPLAKGPAEIHIRYSGILNDQLRGFYISKTKTRKYAVTQFESTDARRAFPCFDEPSFKATFGVTMTVDRGERTIRFVVDADHGLRIVLTGELGENVPAGLDDLAAGGFARSGDPRRDRMRQSLGRAEHQPRPAAGLFRLGEDAKPLGEEHSLGTAMAAIAQQADAFDQLVGKGIDAARQRT